MSEQTKYDSSALPAITTTGLSEQYIKEAFVPFLKDFYKYRYEFRPDTLESSFDNVSEGGLVADGRVQFRQADGAYFLCTFEATSRTKAAEVKYGLNVLYFIWDCIAFGSFCAALSYLWLYSLRFQWLVGLRWNGNLGLVLGLGMIGFFIWYYTLRSWKKYRYIYAIEQFKMYEADEQWVVLGDDVFPAPTDPYLIELKEQCIYNGIGLAVVSFGGAVRLVLSPSRIGAYGGNRRMVHWVTRTQWYSAISNNMNLVRKSAPKQPDLVTQLLNSIRHPLDRYLYQPIKKSIWSLLSRPLGGANSAYDRYMHGHSVQKWVLGLSFSVILVIGFLVLSFRAEEFSDVDQLRKWRPDGPNPEEESYALYAEDHPVPYGKDINKEGIPKQFPGPRDKEAPELVIDFSDKKETAKTTQKKTTTLSSKTEGIETDNTAAKKKELCSIIEDQEGFFIQDNIFATKVNAEARVGNLRNKGVVCRSLWRGCVDTGEDGYIVWIGGVYETLAAAQEKVKELSATLEKNGLTQGRLVVRKIE